jgi:hypothetical protein
MREISDISLPLAVASDLYLSSHDDIVVELDSGRSCQAKVYSQNLNSGSRGERRCSSRCE